MIFLKNLEDISVEALKSNEYYIKKLEEAKKIIKEKIFTMTSKEEQLKYLQEEKTRCTLLKETNNGVAIIALIISLISLITIILLSVLKENVVFLILWLIGIVTLIGALVVFFVINKNSSKVKYSIMIMAYEDVEQRIKGNSISGFTNEQLKQMLNTINQEVSLIQEQLKLIYGLQQEKNNRKK